ncbi:MAG: hydrogenase small subunit [Nitrospirae bacterium]|nr:hydrogenase small subunit [Nitrospirota bacterium]
MGKGDILSKRFLDELEIRGLSRRDFLKYCTATAAILGISEFEFTTKVAHALQTASKKPPVIWFAGQACTGCTISFAQSLNPPAAAIVLDKISLRYHMSVMAAAGDLSERVLHDTIKEGGYIFIFEGSIPASDDRYWMHGKEPGRKVFEQIAKEAAAILAVGACSAYGGIPRAGPTKGISVNDALKRAGINKTAVNISTCPVHPDHLVGTILYVIVTGKVPELDAKGRPAMYFGDKRLLHDDCRRRGHFDAGEFLTDWNDPKQKDWCLFQKGCKGPMAYVDCSIRRWNDGINFCLDCGGLCQACGDPLFYDKVSPLYTADSETSKKIWAMREAGIFKQEKS